LVYKLNIEHKIEKKRLFKKLHIDENTETFRNADDSFMELYEIIKNNMKLTVLYLIVPAFDLGFKKLDECEKYFLCFMSSKDSISSIVNDMMSSGSYLKGYLLNEMAIDVVFNASNEMNNILREKSKELDCKLSKRFAPGDGDIDIKYQKTILDFLKNEVFIDAYLTDDYMIVPQKSLLYLYGLEKIACNAYSLNKVEYNSKELAITEDSCTMCSNLNCQYRDLKR